MSATKSRRTRTDYRCGKCGRRLWRQDGRPRWTFSRFTANRYCWPGEGCSK